MTNLHSRSHACCLFNLLHTNRNKHIYATYLIINYHNPDFRWILMRLRRMRYPRPHTNLSFDDSSVYICIDLILWLYHDMILVWMKLKMTRRPLNKICRWIPTLHGHNLVSRARLSIRQKECLPHFLNCFWPKITQTFWEDMSELWGMGAFWRRFHFLMFSKAILVFFSQNRLKIKRGQNWL